MPWIGPQIATAWGTSNTYLSTIVRHRMSSPTPTTNAATRYRPRAALIFGGSWVVGTAPVAGVPARAGCWAGVRSAVLSADSGGTFAVLLGEFGQCTVVRGQFGVVIVIVPDGGDREDHCLGRRSRRPYPCGWFASRRRLGLDRRRGRIGQFGRRGWRVGVDFGAGGARFGSEDVFEPVVERPVLVGVLLLLEPKELDPHVDERDGKARPQQRVAPVLRGTGGFVRSLPSPPTEPQADQHGHQHQQVAEQRTRPQQATVHAADGNTGGCSHRWSQPSAPASPAGACSSARSRLTSAAVRVPPMPSRSAMVSTSCRSVESPGRSIGT